MSKSLLNKYHLDPKDERYTNIIRILGSNLGLLDRYLGFVINDKITIDRISELNELIKKYKNLLQVNKVYPIEFKNFEDLDDTINNLIIRNEDIKFCKKFISNKYKFLVDDEVISLFGMLRTFEDKHDKIQSLLTSKLAAFKKIEVFKDILNSLISNFNGDYSTNSLQIKSIENDGIVLYKDDRFLLVKTPTYNSCNKLGSTAWCITRSSSYFKSYVSRNNIQYLLFDTKYGLTHPYSLIGITTGFYGGVSSSYDRHNHCSKDYVKKNVPRYIKELLIGATKEDVFNVLSLGNRVSKDVLLHFNISDEEILQYNKYYFSKASDFISSDEDILFNKEFINFLKIGKPRSSKDLKDIYKKLISQDRYDDLLKLLDIKFVNDPDIFRYIIDVKDGSDTLIQKYSKKINLSTIFKTYEKDLELDTKEFINSPFYKFSKLVKFSNLYLKSIEYSMYHFREHGKPPKINKILNLLKTVDVNLSRTYFIRLYNTNSNNRIKVSDLDIIRLSILMDFKSISFDINEDLIDILHLIVTKYKDKFHSHSYFFNLIFNDFSYFKDMYNNIYYTEKIDIILSHFFEIANNSDKLTHSMVNDLSNICTKVNMETFLFNTDIYKYDYEHLHILTIKSIDRYGVIKIAYRLYNKSLYSYYNRSYIKLAKDILIHFNIKIENVRGKIPQKVYNSIMNYKK